LINNILINGLFRFVRYLSDFSIIFHPLFSLKKILKGGGVSLSSFVFI
jgi:hypothetical protein